MALSLWNDWAWEKWQLMALFVSLFTEIWPKMAYFKILDSCSSRIHVWQDWKICFSALRHLPELPHKSVSSESGFWRMLRTPFSIERAVFGLKVLVWMYWSRGERMGIPEKSLLLDLSRKQGMTGPQPSTKYFWVRVRPFEMARDASAYSERTGEWSTPTRKQAIPLRPAHKQASAILRERYGSGMCSLSSPPYSGSDFLGEIRSEKGSEHWSGAFFHLCKENDIVGFLTTIVHIGLSFFC